MNSFDPKRLAYGAAQKFIFNDNGPEGVIDKIARLGEHDRSSASPSKSQSMSRSRDRILANLDDMYREAFQRAKETGDQAQMATLDFAYRREQLYFEILLDMRDAIERR